MPSTFQLYNQYGSLIFDDSLFGVYAKAGAGKAYHPWGSPTSSTPNITLASGGITAVRPNPNSYVSYSHTDSTSNYYLITGHGATYDSAFPYLQLAAPSGVPSNSDTYGLVMFNSSGTKTFDSSMSYFIIRDIVTITLAEALAAASIGTGTFNDVYKTHAYCANPFYILNDYRHIYAQYYSTSSGWTIYFNTTGVAYVDNYHLKIGVGGGTVFNYVSGADKSNIEQMIAANNATFPKYILVGELKNP